MTKSKNKIIFVFMILIITCFSIFSVSLFTLAKADITIETEKEILVEYAFGDTFDIPNCVFTKGGKTANGEGSLTFPDGTQIGETTTLNQSGNYVLKYIAEIDGKTYTKEYAFSVKGRLANYQSSKTTVEYGLCTNFGANSEGLMLKIVNGDSVTFNHVFDMSSLTMSTKILEGFIVPETQGSIDFAKMVFTFTDIEDPSVQLVYHGNFYEDANAYGITWFTAAGNGQIHCGLEKYGKLHVGTNQGCMVAHSFMAMDTGLFWGAKPATPIAPDKQQFCISYDSKTNQTWAGGKIVSDLDDSYYYDKLWFGFPSGKAKLTISALNYSGVTANICLTSLLGVDLSAENFEDKDSPIISVDTHYEEMPTAVVGKSYPIPTATALDEIDGNCKVEVSVWHNYNTDNAKSVDIVNGKFKAQSVGVYAIVYTAKDNSGNIAKEILWIRSNLSQYITPIEIIIDEYLDEIEIGTIQSLPKVSVTGGCGDVSVSYEIFKGKETCPITNDKFVLEKSGEWIIRCIATDYSGNVAVKDIEISGVISGNPIISENPKLPIAFISGSSYELPTLFAKIYSENGVSEILCSVNVEFGGESKTYNSGESFTPSATVDGEKVKITYTCNNEVLFVDEIPVVIVFGKKQVGETSNYRTVITTEKYFYTNDNLAFENGYNLLGVSGLKITANEDMDKASLSFVNAQLANHFSVELFTVPNLSKFSQMSIVLKDSLNSDISVRASLIKNDGQTLLKVGNSSIILLLDFDSAQSSFYSLGFKDNQMVINSTTMIAVDCTENGKPFDGFPSGKIYFDIEIDNLKEGGAIFLSNVCGVNISNEQDNTGPFIEPVKAFEISAYKDSVYTVQRVLVGDVLCPNVNSYLTVYMPNGEIAESVDGIKLFEVDATREYQVKLTEFGDYRISIVARESESWKKTPNDSYFDKMVAVTDGEAPTIKFEKEFKTKLKVGKTLHVPKYTVADNVSKAEEISVMIMVVNPKGMPIYLTNGENSFVCEYSGEYKIYIYVIDKMGNMTLVEKTVIVK